MSDLLASLEVVRGFSSINVFFFFVDMSRVAPTLAALLLILLLLEVRELWSSSAEYSNFERK